MGMDSVELVIRFEETFKIEFTDAEAAKMTYVQDAIDLISQKLSATEGKSFCPYIRAYKTFISTLKKISPNAEKNLRLKEAISSFYSERSKKEFWQGFRYLSQVQDYIVPFYIFRSPTIKECINSLLSNNFSSLKKDNEPWTTELIQFAVHQTIKDLLHVTEVKNSDHFIKDLGID